MRSKYGSSVPVNLVSLATIQQRLVAAAGLGWLGGLRAAFASRFGVAVFAVFARGEGEARKQ